jgi:hypothetical protein
MEAKIADGGRPRDGFIGAVDEWLEWDGSIPVHHAPLLGHFAKI